MPRAELMITIPEEVWIGAVSRSYPSVAFRVLTAFADDESGVALIELTTDDQTAVVADLVDREGVMDVDELHRGDETLLVRIETTEPLLLFPLRESGVPLSFPFSITDGTAAWELTAPNDRLAALSDQLDTFGIQFTVNSIQQHIEHDRLLTERQQQLLVAGVEHGYYDTPRTCSLTELADSVGMAKSTTSETLHRAEGRVVKEFLAGDERTTARIESIR